MMYNLTGCCALIQFRGTNKTQPKEIKNFINILKEGRKEDYMGTPNSGHGATCIFAIVTSPHEKYFEQRLIDEGFKKIHSFDRRTGYPEGKNVMYVLNI